MKVVGLITEYNPFHNGHLYHLQKSIATAGAEYSVAVMSGHFLQRGEPALLDKWSRALMAVKSGVDLVLELPYVFSCRSAYFFARGAVGILQACGIVTHLSFGTEEGDLRPLMELASLYLDEPPEFRLLVKKHLKQGLILPLAQERALKDYLREKNFPGLNPGILNNPNNILGIEYLRSLFELKSAIKPVTVRRNSAGYHDKDFTGSFASATSIREFLARSAEQDYNESFPATKLKDLSKVLPQPSLEILQDKIVNGLGPVFWEDFYPLLLYRLRTAKSEELSLIMDVNEGLENRILKYTGRSDSFRALVENVKTKRYTWTRIQRILNYILMGFTREQAVAFDKAGPRYIRLLAASHKGKQLLALMRKKASLPIITRTAPFYKKSDNLTRLMLDYDLKASDLYTLGYRDPAMFQISIDFLTGPVLPH